MDIRHFLDRPARVIVAVDVPLSDGICGILEALAGMVVGVKFGLVPLLTSRERVEKTIKELGGELYFLADLKLADVEHVMVRVCEIIQSLGFNGLIAHSFVGRRRALDGLVKRARELGLDVFLVVAMSHPGAEEVLNKAFNEMLSVARELEVTGVVAPATMPHYIRRAREILGQEFVILSPGVGAQGAAFGEALQHGADVEIVGRAILLAENPISVVRRIAEIHAEVLRDRSSQLPG